MSKKTRAKNPLIKPLRLKIVGLPDEAGAVVHFRSHAYCVARPALACAVFALPPQMNPQVPGMKYDSSEIVTGDSAFGCIVGEWYSIAYCQTAHGGTRFVVPYQPNPLKI